MTVIDFHGSLCSDLVFLMTLETFGLRTFKKHFGKHVHKCACFCHLQWQLDAFYLPSALPWHLFVCRTLSALQRGVVVLSLGESLSTLGGIFVWMRNTSHHYGFCSGTLLLLLYSACAGYIPQQCYLFYYCNYQRGDVMVYLRICTEWLFRAETLVRGSKGFEIYLYSPVR